MTDNARRDEAKLIKRLRHPLSLRTPAYVGALLSEAADAFARRSIQEQPEVDRVAWLIECKTPEGARWYFEDATGWHSWTPDAHLATSFKTKAEAEKFPAYVMIKTDPNISLTEHVFLEQWKHEPEAETETANNVDDQGRAAPIFDRPAVHGETVGRDAAPPPIAGAGWKPIDTQLRAIMDDLGRTVADPMWADHVELRKSTLRGWIKQIRTALRAPSTKEPMVLIGGQSLVHIAELADMLRNLEIGKHVPVSSQFHEVAMVLGAIAASPVPDNTDARGAIGGTVAIKPLEWSELENGDFVAETIGEDYRVQAGIWASGWYWTKGEMASSAYPFFDEADEAKAAAQADYASRILSAIIPGTDASAVIEQLREALKPFAATAEQLDRPLPNARNGRVTIVHPLDDVVPELRGMTDHECPEWPLPDDMEIISAWRYHDPAPLSEHIAIQMAHLRAARDVLASLEVLAALDPAQEP